MKKTLSSVLVMLSLCLSAKAVEYIDWVDWDRIEHWAGDPNGQKKCALVIDFQDDFDNRALVWGYRWNGTATGEDLVRAVASQSSVLTAMIQYTGTMGSTLNGLGVSEGRDNLNYLHYDFDRAAIGGEVAFGFFSPNITMGQEVAPGYEAEKMCINAIEKAKSTGIIEHPLNAFVYGYPAYDYDYWQLEEGIADYFYRWRAGWYDGYWSYWHGPNDYDYMSYSGLGMSSTVLVDGGVQAWKYTPLNGGSYGTTGGELAEELDYEMFDYQESMHTAVSPVQPVDQNKVDFWVGEGEKSATVVFQFNDGQGPENLVYGYRWTGGWDDNLNTVLKNIAAADPRMTLNTDGSAYSVTYDSNCDGTLGTYDHTDVSNNWYCYVKRVIDDDFNRVPSGRWLNPNAVMVFSHKPEETASVDLPYLLYRPSLNSDKIITIPEEINYALADQTLFVPMFVQVPEGGKINTSFNWTPSTDVKNIVTSWGTSNMMGKANGFKNFKPVSGTVNVRGSYTAPGSTSASYVYSNDVALNIKEPLRPVTSVTYANANVDWRLNHAVENELIIEPADATYTKMTYKSSKTPVATVASTGIVTTTKTAGEATITATYDLDAGISASYNVTSSLQTPIDDVTFECADENGVITLTPKEMAGLFPVLTPADPDIADLTITLSENGDKKDNYIAMMYQVNIWDENNTRLRPYELSGHRIGQCKLTVKSQDNSGFEKEFTVNIVDPEREPAIDYNTGTIMLNEEWFGHTNGGLNWYSPDYDIVYQAYERENPGMSFGCTSQYGIIYDNKLIVCSKQAIDGGDPLPGGGRVVIADASTLKRLGSIDDLMWGSETKSSDGRAAVGAGPGRAYIGTNSGIYIIDTDSAEVIGKVGESVLEGEDNDKPNTDPSSSLYSGQIGDMVLAGHHVFAIRQSTGVYVIDIDTDKIVKFIPDTQVQGITQTADGHVWYATIDENKLSNFVALDHNTFDEVDRVVVPAEIGTVSCGWGAWRTTQFTGAHSVNALFFSPGSSISNGGAGLITRYNIDERTFTPLAKVSGLPAHTPGKVQAAYGTIRYDDRTGEIIAGTTESQASGHYRWNWTHFIDGTSGEILRTIELRPYYWFQAHAIFPDAYNPEIEDIDDITLSMEDEPLEIMINATDRDNNDANIRYHLFDTPMMMDANENQKPVEVKLEGNKLTITPQALGSHTIGLAVESNGKIVNHAINVTVSNLTTDINTINSENPSIKTVGNNIIIKGHKDEVFSIIDFGGMVVDKFLVNSDNYARQSSVANGVYVLISNKGISKKIIIK